MYARLRAALDGCDVAHRQVHDVDIVAHARAVFGGIVAAEHVDLFQFAAGDLRHIRHEVVGDALRVFADEAAFVRADGVEVAQQDDVPAVIRLPQIGEDAFLIIFGSAVRVGGAARAAVFGEGQALGGAVHRGGGGEDDLFDAVRAHGLQQHQGAVDVVVVILERLDAALAHGLQPREMDDRIEFVFGKDLVHRGAVAHVCIVKAEVFARDLTDAHHRLFAGIGEVIDHRHLVTALEQCDQRVAADEAGAARQKDTFHVLPPSI